MNTSFPALGDDLWSLVTAQGTELVSVETITRLPSPVSMRASFKLYFSDGSVLKGKCTESAKRCETLAALQPALEGIRCSRIVAQHGAALLEEWIPGTPLPELDITEDLLTAAGELLGILCRAPVPRDAVPLQTPTPDHLVSQIERRLAGQVAEDVLPSEQAHRLREIALAHQPGRLEIGLVHHDFCAENLVVTPVGSLCAIDNEDMRIGALDADLARTAYRWPLRPTQWEAFCEGYRRHRDTGSFADHELFWSIFTLSGSALFRVRRKLRYSLPLAQLRELGSCRS